MTGARGTVGFDSGFGARPSRAARALYADCVVSNTGLVRHTRARGKLANLTLLNVILTV